MTKVMTLDDKLIFAAAFAGALQAARKGGFEGDQESEDFDRWRMQSALDAANAAGQAVDALAMAEDFIAYMAHKAEGTADPEKAAQATEAAEALAMIGDTIAAFRAGDDGFDCSVDCPYDHEDGACGEHPECAVCGEEDDPRADCEGCEVDCAECLCSVTADPTPKLN